MLEMRITIEAPELAGALNNLAAALGQTKVVPQATAPMPQPNAQQLNGAPSTTAARAASLQPAPMPTPVTPVQPTPMPAPGPVAPVQPTPMPAPNVPLAQPPKYTIDQIMAAGATLMDAGKVNELMNLLHSFGVQAVMDLKPEQLGAFATGLRELGAKI